jgi:hypothetical protein
MVPAPENVWSSFKLRPIHSNSVVLAHPALTQRRSGGTRSPLDHQGWPGRLQRTGSERRRTTPPSPARRHARFDTLRHVAHSKHKQLTTIAKTTTRAMIHTFSVSTSISGGQVAHGRVRNAWGDRRGFLHHHSSSRKSRTQQASRSGGLCPRGMGLCVALAKRHPRPFGVRELPRPCGRD